jgi:hypothetical protein
MIPFARAFRVLTLAALPCAVSGCLPNPRLEAIRQQQMMEIADELNDMRVNLSVMAGTLDSLRVVVTKQDTTIARLANVTGVIVVK